MPHHTSVYQERRRKPAANMDEAIKRLHDSVERRMRDTLAKHYPMKGSPETRRVTLRIVGEKDD